MTQQTFKFISTLTLSILVIGLFFVPSVFAADLQGAIEGNLDSVSIETGLTEPVGGIPTLIGSIIKNVLLFIGVIFISLIIYGGFLWMTAGGNPDKVRQGGAFIKNSVIGLVIIFLSYAIVATVFDVLGKSAG